MHVNGCAAAATCTSINVANSDKESSDGGTGTRTTGGIVAVTCDAGYGGDGNAVCTATGAGTAAFVFDGCEGALAHGISVVVHPACTPTIRAMVAIMVLE